MAIKIVQRPTGPTAQVALPERIEVTQVLRSTKLSEPVRIVYELPEGSGVRFDGQDDAAARAETIARADTPLRHRLQLERVSGSGALRLTIDERILNQEGEILQASSFDIFVK
jgi:hypothetical protein